ncbi:MAG: hypothetical protein WDN28_12450 [Chthoniobacter sp.]
MSPTTGVPSWVSSRSQAARCCSMRRNSGFSSSASHELDSSARDGRPHTPMSKASIADAKRGAFMGVRARNRYFKRSGFKAWSALE